MATTISGNVISTAYKNLVFTSERDADATKFYFTDNSAEDEEITAISTNFTFNGTLTSTGAFVASAASTLAGATTHNSTLTVGEDDTGHDVKFFGATASAYMLWDESQDDLILGGAARMGIGLTDPDTALEILNTSNQLKLSYDGSNATTFGVSSGGDLTITPSGSDITIVSGASASTTLKLGTDADDYDRIINFGHTTLESVIGIDDSADVFAINTDAAFQTTNDLTIDTSGNVTIGNGELRITKIAYTDGDDSITVADGGGITLGSTLSLANNITFTGASDLIVPNSQAAALDITNGSAAFVTINTSANKVQVEKDLYSNSGTYVDGELIAVRPTATSLEDNGSIPITKACANIDAGGGNKTGIRFAGAGTAGQILIVNNTGGVHLTFHNTEGTSLLRGVHADHDNMPPNFVGMFVSDGSRWNLISGGVDTQPDVGLTAG
jgi:hypothetical protein